MYLTCTSYQQAGRQAGERSLVNVVFIDAAVVVRFTLKHAGESILGIAAEILSVCNEIKIDFRQSKYNFMGVAHNLLELLIITKMKF